MTFWHFKAWLERSNTFWAQDILMAAVLKLTHIYVHDAEICLGLNLHNYASLSCWICYTICHSFVEESVWLVDIWHARVMPRRVKIPPTPRELVYSHRQKTLMNLSLKKLPHTQCIIPKSNWWHRNYPRKLKTLMNLFYTNPIKMQSSIWRTSNLPPANAGLFRISNQGSITATVSH